MRVVAQTVGVPEHIATRFVRVPAIPVVRAAILRDLNILRLSISGVQGTSPGRREVLQMDTNRQGHNSE